MPDASGLGNLHVHFGRVHAIDGEVRAAAAAGRGPPYAGMGKQFQHRPGPRSGSPSKCGCLYPPALRWLDKAKALAASALDTIVAVS